MRKIQQQLTADGRKDREYVIKRHLLVHVGRNRAGNLNNHNWPLLSLCRALWQTLRAKMECLADENVFYPAEINQ